MKPVDQQFVKDVSIGQFGDCQRAVIASLLDLPIDQVPHFAQEANGSPREFWERIDQFLEARGFELLAMGSRHVADHAADMGGYHQISGPSPRGQGIHHAVVGLNGQLAHDPHPSKSGLAGDPSSWTHSYIVRLK